jgi:hypothetical protein
VSVLTAISALLAASVDAGDIDKPYLCYAGNIFTHLRARHI